MKKQEKKYARVCSVTGRGMWAGWIFNDGQYYAIDEESANKIASELGYTDYEDAYNNDSCYYTDWHGCEPEYIEIDGKIYDYAE
jgi:hypothetical protein